MSSPEENRQRIIKFVQELLLDDGDLSAVTPALISTKIDMVLGMKPAWADGLDRDAVTDELIRRFSLWIGTDSTIKSEAGHVPWLTAARKKDWRYWQRYRELLERKLSYRAVEALDNSTGTVLGLLEDPTREGQWDRRGLVVGHVQSGKTGHYTGLISKAADAGYKIIIVLAGLHNNLRSQTQIRLDEGFLGYETKPDPEDIRVIGVGEIDADPSIRPNYATNRSEAGDFSTAVARNLGISPEQRPWLFVVKKNKTVLERLFKWIKNHVANTQDAKTGRKLVSNLPLLLIDDEADHASVDTGEQIFGADGKPDLEHEPTAINSRIRKILHTFTRSAYVGYTATPFANIFIHERSETGDEGPDLFPAAFVINLAAPSDYVGPARVFGLASADGREGGMPLVRIITDHVAKDGSGWMPPKHRNGHVPVHDGSETIPPSLVDAIDAYVLTSAIRRLRGQGSDHCSMLIHVTRFNSVQSEVRRQVDEHVRQLRQRIKRRIDHEGVLDRMHTLWKKDFLATSEKVRSRHPDWVVDEDSSWEDIVDVLPDTLADIEVRTINGTAKDALDYIENASTGLKVIAIGGDKLSRGLTLEGLCVSYFLRASKMYDTLMQMGRWFGYRPGYVDLCRLYMPLELEEWFGHIADAAEELREEFDMMSEAGATPREYGLKVASHPVLMVTSPLKMRTAKTLWLSFSGRLLETVALYRDRRELDINLRAAVRLVEAMGRPAETNPERKRTDDRTDAWKGYLWEAVPFGDVVDFLLAYRTHPAARKVNSAMLAEFIRGMAESGELTKWTVALIGGGTGEQRDITPGISVAMNKRAGDELREDRYSIGRLLDPKDEAIALDIKAWQAALEFTRRAQQHDPARLQDKAEAEIPNGPAIRHIRGQGAPDVKPAPESGLLIIYALDPQKAGVEFPEGTPPIIAFAVSFPESKSKQLVEYKVNNVLWEQEYGSAD
ncbi:MAG TPA: Z1 domain-containing protein [Nevskia sp.]|nr:Z1 domain-containing protein [Nevskia sp.]